MDFVRAILDQTKTVNLDPICWIWADLAVLNKQVGTKSKTDLITTEKR